MVRTHNGFQSLLAVAGLLVLIFDSEAAAAGAAEGLELCIKTVIPSLFPFFVLSSVLTGTLAKADFAALRIPGRALGIPENATPILIPAFLGGYPVGAKCIGDLYQRKQLSRQEAQRLLAFCSNAGPSFLFGMAASFFPDRNAAWAIWLVHIAAVLLTALVIPRNPEPAPTAEPETQPAPAPVISSAAKAMGLVCCWVILFRMILTFLSQWFLWMLPPWARVPLTGSLELVNGCCAMMEIGDVKLRFVVCCCILSCGGICVLLQTASVTQGLSLGYYCRGKLLQTLFSLLLSWGTVSGHGLGIAAALTVLVLLFRKIQNRYGNLRPFPV